MIPRYVSFGAVLNVENAEKAEPQRAQRFLPTLIIQ